MSSSKKALILGVSGQDGAYLAKFLLSKGYEVHGTSREVGSRPFLGLDKLGIKNLLTLHSASLIDFRHLLQVITTVEPDEIYNLAGQSSVGVSFNQPMETMESIAVGTLQILEVIRYLDMPIRFYNAGSSECFGDIEVGKKSDENTPFYPRSPYASAKAAAFWATVNYREAYGMYVCSGILYNHESALRPERFVTKKIISTAVRIAHGSKEKLNLGNINIWRDWGYVTDFVEAMWLMLQQKKAQDFVIATGKSNSLETFISIVFSKLKLDWKTHVNCKEYLKRPSDLMYSCGNAEKAERILGWRASTSFDQMIDILVNEEIKKFKIKKHSFLL